MTDDLNKNAWSTERIRQHLRDIRRHGPDYGPTKIEILTILLTVSLALDALIARAETEAAADQMFGTQEFENLPDDEGGPVAGGGVPVDDDGNVREGE